MSKTMMGLGAVGMLGGAALDGDSAAISFGLGLALLLFGAVFMVMHVFASALTPKKGQGGG